MARRGARALRLSAFVAGTLVASVLPSAPASATHQELWWNENADSFKVFGPNASVTIYQGRATANTCDGFEQATDVYVVAESSLGPGQSLTDVSNPTGVPNTVFLVSGGIFIDETIGFAQPGGHLGSGTYGVVYDECQDGIFDGHDKLFYPAFEVEIPADVPPIDPHIAALKSEAGTEADNWQELVAMVDAIQFLHELKGYYECITGGLTGCLVSYISDKFRAFVKEATMGFFGLQDPEEAAKDMVLDNIKHYNGIEADPPDPDFRRLSPLLPRPPLGPQTQDGITTALVDVGNAAATERALAEAILRSVERYQGADAASSGTWALVHARAIQSNASRLSAHLALTGSELSALSSALSADTRDFDALAASAEPVRSRIATSGFAADETRVLRNHGATQADIDSLRTDITSDSSGGFTKAALQTRISGVRAAHDTLKPTLDTLVTDVQGVIDALVADPGTLDDRPRAVAGGPYTVAEGSPITLDGSASTDLGGTISLYEWDLDNDGAFDEASGATPAHAFPLDFDALIGLRVTDNSGKTGIGYARATVTPANGPPSIDASLPAGDQVEVIVGSSLPFTVTATDPDGDAVSVRWLLDFVEVATGPAFTYMPAPSEIGMHLVRAEVSDGPAGGTAVREWGVSALAADADADGWRANVDCDETNPNVNPGHPEVIGNQIDDDCDPATPDTGSPPVALFNPFNAAGRNVALLEAGASVVAFSSQFSTTFPPANMLNYTTTDTSWATGNGLLTNQFAKIQLAGGGTYLVDRIKIMGRTDASTQRVKDFAIDVSTTTADDTAFTNVLNATALNNANLQLFTLAQPVLAKFVRYRPLTNYGSTCCISTEQLKIVTSTEGTSTVEFRNLSSDANGDITSTVWDFGDGTTSTDLSPTHTYASPGSYTVTLTVTDSVGQQSVVTRTQRVLAPPTGSFTFTPATPLEASSATFTSAMSDPDGGTIADFSWDWGDGTADGFGNPRAHSFADNGTYRVTLTVVDAQEQTASTFSDVAVANRPATVNAGSNATVRWGESWTPTSTVGDPSTVDDNTLRCDWVFGDGQTATVTNCTANSSKVPHAYADPGTYTATLQVTDKDGGTASDSATITVAKRDTFVNVYPVPGSAFGGKVDVVVRLFDRFRWSGFLSGRTITIGVGTESASVTTDSTGTAGARLTLTEPDTLTAAFAGDARYNASSDSQSVAPEPGLPPGDVVFMVDESGSMGSEQSAVKSNLQFIANRLGAEIDYQLSLVGFGGPTTHALPNGAAHTHLPLTQNLTSFSGALNELSTGGGFEPGYEAVAWAMGGRMGYRETSGVCGVLIGDEPPQGTTTQAQALAALQSRGAILLAIVDSAASSQGYRDLATQSGGASFSIASFVADPNPVLAALLDRCVAEIVLRPDLVVSIDDGTGTIRAGRTTTYTLTVSNAGQVGATGVGLRVDLPPETAFESASDGGSAAGGVATWPSFDLADGATVTRTITVRAAKPLPPGTQSLTAVATVSDDGTHGTDLTPANNTSSDTDLVVPNVAPALDPVDDVAMDEGGDLTIPLSATDPEGDAITLRAALPAYASLTDLGGGRGTLRFLPLDDDVATIQVEACDVDECTTEELTLTVRNVAPTPSGAQDGNIAEGSTGTITATQTDPGVLDTFEYAFDCGGGFGSFESSATGACAFDQDGTYPVGIRVRDDDGGVGETTIDVIVGNVPPIPDAGGPYQGVWGVPVRLTGSGSDVSPVDAALLTFEWDADGDGTFDSPGAETGFAYPARGPYTATLRVCDDDTCALDTAQVTIALRLAVLDASPVLGRVIPGVRVTFPTLVARLTDGVSGDGIPGRTVWFASLGKPVCSAVTDDDGYAVCNEVLVAFVAVLGLGVDTEFAGDPLYLSARDRGSLLEVDGQPVP